MDQALFIEGRIIFGATISAFNNATIHIYLEDVSYADAGALVVAEKIIPNVRHNTAAERKAETIIDFKLDFEQKVKIEPHNDYDIRVWVDIDNDGESSAQDLYSDQSFRVLTQGFGNKVEIMFTS